MRIVTAVAVLALALPAPALPEPGEARGGERRRASKPSRDERLLVHAAALPVTTVGDSSLVFAAGDRFFATGVRLTSGGRLATWIVEWPMPAGA
jgi:hypothetical protein